MPDTINTPHTALLVLDCQNGILGTLPDAEPLLARAQAAIELMRRHDGHVGFVRVGFAPGEFDAIPAYAPMARGATPERREYLRSDAPSTQIHDQLTPQPGDITVRKIRVGAFSTTDLAQQLADRGVTTLVLAGVSTSGAVLSTVRDASDRDFRIIVLSDACADPDPETHAFLTERIFPRHTDVITAAELESLLDGSGSQGG